MKNYGTADDRRQWTLSTTQQTKKMQTAQQLRAWMQRDRESGTDPPHNGT